MLSVRTINYMSCSVASVPGSKTIIQSMAVTMYASQHLEDLRECQDLCHRAENRFDARWELRDREPMAGKVAERVTETLKMCLGLGKGR